MTFQTMEYREALASIIATNRVEMPQNYPPYDYQYHVWADQSRFRIFNKSRQIGMSWGGVAIDATAKALSKVKDYILVSRSERQAYQLGDYIDTLLAPFPGVRVKPYSRSEKKLSNGSRILCLPNSPDTIRTFNGDVYLDEFALFINNTDYAAWKAVAPMITRGHNITICSTPFGERGLFYDIWNNTGDKWGHFKHIEIPWWLCPDFNEGEIRLICPDEESFQQEYCCMFLGETTNIFPSTLLMKRMQDYQFDMSTAALCPYWGMDVGRKKDATTIIGLYREPELNRLRVGHLEILKDMPFRDQKVHAGKLLKDAVCAKVDATGMGMQLAEDLGFQLGSLVDPVTFTEAKKIELATRGKNAMLDASIEIPDHDQLRLELHSLQKKITDSGHIKIEGRGKDHHADLAWAFLLAVEAATVGKEFGPSFVDGMASITGGF